MNGKILILHASCGGGHKSAARALAKAFAKSGRETITSDALDGMSSPFRSFYTGSFESSVSHAPGLYGAVFTITRGLDRSPVFRAARGFVNKANGLALARTIRRAQPAAVVCTHFLPLEVALRERAAGRLDAPIYAVVTDYCTHGFWRQPDADLTFCPPGRAEFDLLEGDVPAEKIVRAGIPIDEVFGEDYDLATAKQRAGLPAERPTVVLLGGGMGMGPVVPVLRETARALRGEAELVVVCGKNEELLAEATAAAKQLDAPVRVRGFVDPIVDLLRGADVVVTKPGGLTTSECLALGKPLVFYEAAPGQESANVRYAVDRGAGIDGGSPEAAARAAAELVRDPARRERLARRARTIGRPGAAHTIVETILSQIHETAPHFATAA
jgi:processive 1,2-diacylglycerol beta-glucosyltransferase